MPVRKHYPRSPLDQFVDSHPEFVGLKKHYIDKLLAERVGCAYSYIRRIRCGDPQLGRISFNMAKQIEEATNGGVNAQEMYDFIKYSPTRYPPTPDAQPAMTEVNETEYKRQQ